MLIQAFFFSLETVGPAQSHWTPPPFRTTLTRVPVFAVVADFRCTAFVLYRTRDRLPLVRSWPTRWMFAFTSVVDGDMGDHEGRKQDRG